MTRRHVWLGVQVAVTVALLATVFWRFDWAGFRRVLDHVSAGFYLGSLAAIVSGQMLYALRWKVVLAGMGCRVPYSEVLHQYLVACFLGSLMPTTIGGDAAKVYYLGRRLGYVEVTASVFVDRFVGFLWLAAIGAALSWLAGAPSALFVLNRNLLTMFAAALATFLAIAWVTPVERVERLVPMRLRLPGNRLSAWSARAQQFVAYVRVGGCRLVTLAAAAGVALAYLTLLTFVYRRFFAANGAEVPGALPVMNVLASMSVFVNVPISVNGIGLREQLHYLLFAALGLPKEVSVSLSLLLFSHFMLVSLVGYGLWLRDRPAVPEAAV
jgi:uncharacterized membrane protein YbhN (UPF0104 family)